MTSDRLAANSSPKGPYVVVLVVTIVSMWIVRVAVEALLVSSRQDGSTEYDLTETYAGRVLGSIGLPASVLAGVVAVVAMWSAGGRVNRVAPGIIAAAFGFALLVPGTYLDRLLSSSTSGASGGFAISLTVDRCYCTRGVGMAEHAGGRR